MIRLAHIHVSVFYLLLFYFNSFLLTVFKTKSQILYLFEQSIAQLFPPILNRVQIPVNTAYFNFCHSLGVTRLTFVYGDITCMPFIDNLRKHKLCWFNAGPEEVFHKHLNKIHIILPNLNVEMNIFKI